MAVEEEKIFLSLKKRDIIDILDGDKSFGSYKLSDGRDIDIAMPYLTGYNIVKLEGIVGGIVAGRTGLSRWMYFEQLIDLSIKYETTQKLITYLFGKRHLRKTITGVSDEEFEVVYSKFIDVILSAINDLLQIDDVEIINNNELFLLQNTGDSLLIDPFGNKLIKGNIAYSAFNEYTLVEQIGQGGNGKVWQATDKNNDIVAIKFLERDAREATLKRFKNETFFCIKNKHKNIIPILDYGTAGKNFIFYVMPKYPTTLKDKIRDGIDPEEAINIFIGIIEGLGFAHSLEVVHRDIKPENILFDDKSGEPIIADFGIAHFKKEDLATMIQTKKGDRMANYMYAAPEQKKSDGKSYPQSDIYAAGLILNEMFTKEVPQAAGYKTIASVDANYGFLDTLFDKLYQQNPEDRLYPDSEIIKELYFLDKQEKTNKAKEELKDVVFKVEGIEQYNLKVNKVDYENGLLIFDFGVDYPDAWYQIISNGLGNHTCIMGYDTNRLQKRSKHEMAMPIRSDESDKTIASIVGYVKEWVVSANNEYNRRLKIAAEQKLKAQEANRQEELERIEKEKRIRNIVSNL